MKRFFGSVFLMGFLVSLSQYALADKIGYVNYEAAVSQEHEAKDVLTKLEGEKQALVASQDKARTELEAEVEKFRASAGKLDEKARAAQEVALGNKYNALQQKLTQDHVKFEEKTQKEHAEILKKNQFLVDDIGKEGKFDLVINSQAIVFASDRMKKNDLTTVLAAKYNSTYKKAEGTKTKSENVKKKSENVKKKSENTAPAPKN